MLYDPKWEKPAETKADPLTLPAFIAWLEKQPPEKEYDYYNCGGACLVGQYMQHHGVEWTDGIYAEVWSKPFGLIAAGHPRTFGGALERAPKWYRARV